MCDFPAFWRSARLSFRGRQVRKMSGETVYEVIMLILLGSRAWMCCLGTEQGQVESSSREDGLKARRHRGSLSGEMKVVHDIEINV